MDTKGVCMTLFEMEKEFFNLAIIAARSKDNETALNGIKYLAKILQHQKELNAESDKQMLSSMNDRQRAALRDSSFYIKGDLQ